MRIATTDERESSLSKSLCKKLQTPDKETGHLCWQTWPSYLTWTWKKVFGLFELELPGMGWIGLDWVVFQQKLVLAGATTNQPSNWDLKLFLQIPFTLLSPNWDLRQKFWASLSMRARTAPGLGWGGGSSSKNWFWASLQPMCLQQSARHD